MIIAVDFDGTCVEHMYPDVGISVPYAVMVLKELSDAGHRLILFTMRSDDTLDAAVSWFEINGIPLFGVNTNPEQKEWTNSPKAYAQRYIDDAAVGCPLRPGVQGTRPMVDWLVVRNMILYNESDGINREI